MKKRIYLIMALTVCFLAGFSNKSQASHAAGGEILYEWISDSTYRFYFKFYRDCNGISEPATVDLCYYNTCGSQSYTSILSKVTGQLPGGGFNGQEVSTGCPGYSSTCSGGPITNPGYKEWWYTNIITLPMKCNFWKFYVSINARNTNINNLQNPGGQSLHIECTFNNLAAQGNSSPYFTVKPIPFMCVNSTYTYNNGAVDPNGDSLVFNMINPLNSAVGTCVANPAVNAIQYAASTPPYNIINNPLQTNNTFSINNATGQLTFTPSIQQNAAITIQVSEYRNGVLIGTVMRDIQVVVLNCTAAPPAFNPDTTSFSGAQLGINGNLEGCALQPMSFCVSLNSNNPAAILVATSNNAIVTPSSVVTYTGQGTDSIVACFSWVPQIADSGLKILTFTVKDSTCTPPGILLSQTFSIPLFIYPITVAGNDTLVCPADSAHLSVKGGSVFVWTVLPGGDPNTLTCDTCQFPIATPSFTTSYQVVSNIGNNLCNHNTDTVTVFVLPTPTFDLGPDITTCIGSSVQLNANLVPDSGYTYSYSWNPPTFLNAANIPNPISSPTQDINYFLTITPIGAVSCPATDTISITVLQGFTVFNHDTAICDGSSVQINAFGPTQYSYAWSPTIGVSNPSIIDPLITPDTSRLYKITASFPGCADTTQQIFIDVQPNPMVFAGTDGLLCYGDTVNLFAQVTPAAYPSYSYTWTPSGGLDNPNVQNPNFTGLINTTLTVTVKTPAGCSGTDNIFFEVIAPDIVQVSSPDTMLCPRDTAQLNVTGTAVSVMWTPNLFIDNPDTINAIVYPPVTTLYTVIGTDINNCKDTASIEVIVHPDAVVSLPDSATIYPGQTYQMNPSGNGLYFTWFPPTGLSNTAISNPIAEPTVDTRYHVLAATEYGCIATDSIDIYVSYETPINIANAFSPGSQPNPEIKVQYIGNATLKSFIIYNRWGAKVFETSDISKGWDGRFNGEPQPMGVYIYTVEAVSSTGRPFVKQGNITLIR